MINYTFWDYICWKINYLKRIALSYAILHLSYFQLGFQYLINYKTLHAILCARIVTLINDGYLVIFHLLNLLSATWTREKKKNIILFVTLSSRLSFVISRDEKYFNFESKIRSILEDLSFDQPHLRTAIARK